MSLVEILDNSAAQLLIERAAQDQWPYKEPF